MKKQKIILFEIIFLLCFIIVSIILNQNSNIKKEKKLIKEMTVSEYDNSITELNKSHEDYAMQVQENKKKLAQAISNENVETSEDATVDEMVTNIGKILETRTSDATATADDIVKGKTAYVNGELIVGNANEKNYEILWENSNPTSISSFNVECANVNKYNKIIICFTPYYNDVYTDEYFMGERNETTQTMYTHFNNTTSVYGTRTVTLNGNVFTFSNGYFSNVGHGINESTIIPKWIMGINIEW